MSKNVFALVLSAVALVLAGCGTTSLTNLTSTVQPRNPNNLYLIEYQWDTTKQAVRPDSVKPTVITGFETYEMRPVLNMTNRWEALVPIPASQSALNAIGRQEDFTFEFQRQGDVQQIEPATAEPLGVFGG